MAQRKSCGAEILWAITPTGKGMPLDVNLQTTAIIENKDQEPLKIDKFVSGYNSHFATCPNAKQHRKKT